MNLYIKTCPEYFFEPIYLLDRVDYLFLPVMYVNSFLGNRYYYREIMVFIGKPKGRSRMISNTTITILTISQKLGSWCLEGDFSILVQHTHIHIHIHIHTHFK